MPPILKIISWNCRRVGNKETLKILKNLINKHNLDYVFLMETKCNYDKMVNIGKSLGFHNVELVETRCYAEGITLFW